MKTNLMMVSALALAVSTVAQAETVVVDGDAGGESSTSFNPNGATFFSVGLTPASSKPGVEGTLFAKDDFVLSFEITDGTTFGYEPVTSFGDFDPVNGTIVEHSTGQVFATSSPRIGFNVGTANERNIRDFNIGFDDSRTQGSGFFFEDVTGDFQIPLFDFDTPTEFTAAEDRLVVESSLLFSPEFSQFLQDEGFTTADTTGTSAGVARIDAAVVPEPTSGLVLLGVASVGLLLRPRRA